MTKSPEVRNKPCAEELSSSSGLSMTVHLSAHDLSLSSTMERKALLHRGTKTAGRSKLYPPFLQASREGKCELFTLQFKFSLKKTH